MKTTAIGSHGEQLAAEWLSRNGFDVKDRNWKSRWCEIDIIAVKGDDLYFIEVKYRKNTNFGDGLEYITTKKLQQMTFAAEFWMHHKNYSGACQLAAISIDGASNEITFAEI